jgi:beta-N-acetylhexosaminidase
LKIRSVLVLILLAFFSSQFYAQSISLREKIGQMIIIGFNGKNFDKDSPIAQSITNDNIGGVILFDYNQQSQTFDKNIESPEQVKLLNSKLQQFNSLANKQYHRVDLPLLISVDYESGNVNRLHSRYGYPEIPSAKKIGTMGFEKADYFAELMTRTLQSSEFNLNFFPDVDLNVNPQNPIIGKKERSFSIVPELVTKYAQIYSDHFLDKGIQCSYKHFPGHGSSYSDSHLGFVDVTDTWGEQELFPFLHSLSQSKHCGMIMIAHIVNRKLDASGVPASLSYPMINGLLRNQLKFDGVVVTDDMQMKAITNYYGEETAMVMAINAGADMLIFGNQLVEKFQSSDEIIRIIEQKVRSGEIPEQRIDEAYQRIVQFKKSLINQ